MNHYWINKQQAKKYGVKEDAIKKQYLNERYVKPEEEEGLLLGERHNNLTMRHGKDISKSKGKFN